MTKPAGLQIVGNDRITALAFGLVLESIRGHGVQPPAGRVHSEPENRVKLVRRSGEIARVPFSIGDDDLALGNAAEEEALTLRVKGDAFRNELWIFEPKGYGSQRS